MAKIANMPSSNWLSPKGDKTHQNGYSTDEFMKLRVLLMALSEELEPVIGKL